MAKSKEKSTPKQKRQAPEGDVMRKRLRKFLTEDGGRLVSKSKLKALAKSMDPKMRMDARVHDAAVKAMGLMIMKAMQRVYDNKRGTIRPSDL